MGPSAKSICGDAMAIKVRGEAPPDAVRGLSTDISPSASTCSGPAKYISPSASTCSGPAKYISPSASTCSGPVLESVIAIWPSARGFESRGAAPPGANIFFANVVRGSAIAISTAKGSAKALPRSAIATSFPKISTRPSAGGVGAVLRWASRSEILLRIVPGYSARARWPAGMADDVPGAPAAGRVAGEGGARKYRDSTPRASSWKAMSIGRASGSTMPGRIVPNHLDRDRRVRAAIALPPKSDEVTSTRSAQVLFRSFFRWLATLSPSRLQKGSMGISGSPASSVPSTASSSPSRKGIRTRAA